LGNDQQGTAIDVRNVVKVYGDPAHGVTALKSVSLDIQDNEFFTLLGPSGCGKTTLLRLMAGFETVTSGEIMLFGDEIEDLPPNRRPVNTVFQHYALFPHMTVAENVGFGLRMLKRPKAEIPGVVQQMLDLVKLGHLADRKPSQLSGGQQQRVALARALANRPRVLLLDEPLSALDLKLRQAMRVELKQIQQETGITFIFVTHDQEEALAMSDRIAVMSEGEVQQIGAPVDIYDAPVNHFVADFIGETNFVDVTIIHLADGMATCLLPGGGGRVICKSTNGCSLGDKVSLSIRPEKLSISQPLGEQGEIVGRIEGLIYLGTDTHYRVRLPDDSACLVRVQNAHASKVAQGPGDEVALVLDTGAARMLAD